MFVTETLDVLILMHLSWLVLVFSLSLVPYNSGELLLSSLAPSIPHVHCCHVQTLSLISDQKLHLVVQIS